MPEELFRIGGYLAINWFQDLFQLKEKPSNFQQASLLY